MKSERRAGIVLNPVFSYDVRFVRRSHLAHRVRSLDLVLDLREEVLDTGQVLLVLELHEDPVVGGDRRQTPEVREVVVVTACAGRLAHVSSPPWWGWYVRTWPRERPRSITFFRLVGRGLSGWTGATA